MNMVIINNGNTGNNGVMAMAVALYSKIKEKEPGVNMTVVLDNPYNAKKDCSRFAKYGVPTMRSSLGNALYKYRFFYPVIGAIWLLIQCLPKSLFQQKGFDLRRTDVVVSLCGEDFFSDNWGWPMCFHTLFQFLAAQFNGVSFVVLAQTFGPFERGWSRWIAKYCLCRARLVTARDIESFELIRKLGAVNNSYLVSDLAFMLEPDLFKDVCIAHDELRGLEGQKFIGVSVSELFGRSVFEYIPDRNDRLNVFTQELAKVLDNLVEKYDFQIVFVPHVVMKNNDDRCAARNVANLMKRKNKIKILHEEYNASEIKAVIQKASLFIGCRMHALIAAVSQSVPTLALAYSPKTIGVFRKGLQYPYVMDIRDMSSDLFVSEMLKNCSRLISETSEVQKFLKIQLDNEIMKNSYKNIMLLHDKVFGEI